MGYPSFRADSVQTLIDKVYPIATEFPDMWYFSTVTRRLTLYLGQDNHQKD